MSRIRFVLGVLALLGLAAGLNLLVFERDPFAARVFVPLGAGVLCGALWLALRLTRVVESIERGRTAATLNTVLGSLAFLGICIVLYAFARHGGHSWDLTQEGRKPLADQTVQILRGLEQDVEVYGLFLKTGDRELETTRDKTQRFLERCARLTSRLKLEFFDPQLETLKFERLGIDRVSTRGTVVVRSGARQRVLMLSEVTSRLEERDFVNALINVVRGSQPKLYFLKGHGEADIASPDPKAGLAELRRRLEAEAYLIEECTINPASPQIPADCDILVICGPTRDLQVPEVEAMQNYLDGGGRLLVMIDPWRVVRSGVENFRPWLEHNYGIVIGSDIIITPSTRPEEVVSVGFTPDFGLLGLDQPDLEIRGSYSERHPITRGFDQNMVFSLARSVTLAPRPPERVVGEVLLHSLPGTWAETNLDLLWEQQKADPDDADLLGPFGVAVAVTAKTDVPLDDTGRTRDARIVVVGDTGFVTNESIAIAGHLNFIMNTVAWLSESEELIAIRPTGREDKPLLLSDREERAIVWLVVLGTLQVIVAAGLLAQSLRRKYA